MLFWIGILFFVLDVNSVFAQADSNFHKEVAASFKGKIVSDFYFGEQNYVNGKKVSVDSLWVGNSTLKLFLNKSFAEMPFREKELTVLKDSILAILPELYKEYILEVYANNVNVEELIPNYYRNEIEQNRLKLTQRSQSERKNVVQKQRAYEISGGLARSNISLWHSHGWYYEPTLDRWEWQRARLFTSLEDISPAAFVIPYIAPMLENAGANVFIPRERDWQFNELIVDNNGSSGKSKFRKPKGKKSESPGFAKVQQIDTNENPFELGTSVQFQSTKKGNRASYIPEIPANGEYGVSVSYGKGDGKVTYRVFHSGGTTDFIVDQRMGYGTWIYLGKFHFKQGIDKKGGKVELIVQEGSKLQFSADAVRFGGGMGNIARKDKTSGKARFFEGARYYLQYAGAPDTLVWNLTNGEDDYKDDYMCRGEWVDWLVGSPFGPTKNRKHPGLGIPIDLAFAFHTDAGILPGDAIVGTLGIYSTERDTNVFADGQSKYASRDLTDIIQSEIVDDVNAIYKCDWTRRGMWNAQYSEAYRPQVPTMLLELLSHQNLNDVRYVLHPKYRFDISRAIYKGILRFLAVQNAYDYVVQPLPVDHMAAEFVGENSIKLSWKPVTDPLEPSADPKKYMVYKRIGEYGFDNGTRVERPEITLSDLEAGKIYGFKVSAVNEGGESFPSEIISVGIASDSKGDVLIVNGFDRVDGPAIFETDSLSGVFRQLDHGVADGYDIATTGDQYDFDRRSPWLDDDSPGHGASYADLETIIFRGNTYDFSHVHGAAFMANGYSFVTVSDEVLESTKVDLKAFVLVDLLFGEEKTTVFPGMDKTPHFVVYSDALLKVLENYTQSGGDIIISGAYIGSEIPKEKTGADRIGNILGFKWRTNHAVKNGRFYTVDESMNLSGEFNTAYKMGQYAVEAPDGIEAFGEKAKTILRYSENNVSAGVFYKGKHKVVALGFPFETIVGENRRKRIMADILELIRE